MKAYLEKLTDEIRIRAEGDLKKKLKVIAKRKREKYQTMSRNILRAFVESEEAEEAKKKAA